MTKPALGLSGNTLSIYKQYGKPIREVLMATFADKKLRQNFLLCIVALIVGIISNLSIPFLLKKVLETFNSHNSSLLSFCLVGYGLVWTISQGMMYVRSLWTSKIEQRITYVLEVKVLNHLFNLSHNYFLNQKPGGLTNIIRRAQKDVPSIVTGLFFYVIPTVVEFALVIFLIFRFYPFIYSFLMMGILVLFFIYTSLSMRAALKVREQANVIDKNADGIITDWISNYEAIKIFAKQDFALEKCEEELKKRETAELRYIEKYIYSRLGRNLILGVGFTILTYLTGQGVVMGTLTVGDFILFNGYILQFILPVSILGQVTQEIKKAILDLKGIVEVLITKTDIMEVPEPIVLSGTRFKISFVDVSFKYRDQFILENITFNIEPGKTVLVIGATGIGKSTMAKLLMRLYDPTHGEIYINGINLKEISLRSLYETVAYVSQDTYLLNDTIKANVQIANTEASLFEIESALEKAHLSDFVNNLPLGLETIVGDRGLKLSGGEKQRISLARLFLRKPKICILDECTSSLDKETDSIIQSNIEKYLSDTTKVIITHRPFMVGKADKIITLSKHSGPLLPIPNVTHI